MKSIFFALLVVLFCCVSHASHAQTTTTPTYAPLQYKFVADIEVAYGYQQQARKTTNARIFGDPTTTGFPCVVVTQNRTIIKMPQVSDLAQVVYCGLPPVNIRFADLDPELQLLARICHVIKWPDNFNTPSDEIAPLTPKQLAGVPVYSGTARCYPKPTLETTCYCTCRWAFDDANWVGETRQSLRAQEITECASGCFPEAFVSVMSMMAVKMAPEMIVGNCVDSYQQQQQQQPNHQNTDGTSIIYNYGVSTNFPSLPAEFAANFKVTLLEYGVSFDFSQTFSSLLRAARTSIFTVTDAITGEFASGETYLTHGTSQMVFRLVHNTIHANGADNTAASYENIDSCNRMIFDDVIFASSVHRLLMVPSTAPPVFVGRYTVRGIPCDLWTQAVGVSTRVDWYFPITNDTAEKLPRRIVLRGIGRSPFFVNHPFIPTTKAVALDDSDFCDRKPFFYDPHCNGLGIDANNMQYQHVIDIAELPRDFASNSSIYLPPSMCTSAGLTNGYNCDGVNGVIVFFLSLICLVVGVYSGRTCCAPKKSKLEDEENGGGTEQQQQKGNRNNNNNNNNGSAPSAISSGVRN